MSVLLPEEAAVLLNDLPNELIRNCYHGRGSVGTRIILVLVREGTQTTRSPGRRWCIVRACTTDSEGNGKSGLRQLFSKQVNITRVGPRTTLGRHRLI